MNILFFLIPKEKVAYIYDHYTLRQTLEKMEFHHYSAIPILDKENRYIGTITEGDLLWTIKNDFNLNSLQAESYPIMKIKRNHDNKAVNINTNMEDLIHVSMNQNFVPVVDDRDVFIGMITRKDIIKYFYSKIQWEQSE